MPRAAVRITIREHDIDNFGFLTAAAVREIRGLLADIPTAARITVDLGPLQKVDLTLVQEFAQYVDQLRLVEARDWRVAEQYILDQIFPPGVVV
jgi:hypothetical protein